jgi:hypothetical protein
MVSNALLSILSQHYKLRENVHSESGTAWSDASKEHADLFGAYIGAVQGASSQGSLPVDTLRRSFQPPYMRSAFPDLEDRIKILQAAMSVKQPVHELSKQ